MKRKTISLLLALTIATFGMTACGNNSEQEISSEQPESVTETEQVETETETEQVETSTEAEAETEQVETSTEAETETEEEPVIAEPISDKDLQFSIGGYDSYNEYTEAGNLMEVYVLSDKAVGLTNGQLIPDDNCVIVGSDVIRNIKIGDSIDKVFEVYGDADI